LLYEPITQPKLLIFNFLGTKLFEIINFIFVIMNSVVLTLDQVDQDSRVKKIYIRIILYLGFFSFLHQKYIMYFKILFKKDKFNRFLNLFY